jgi:hypothetical protein
MNLLTLMTHAQRLPLDKRYAVLIGAKKHFKPRSIEMGYLLRAIERVQFKRLRRDIRKAA